MRLPKKIVMFAMMFTTMLSASALPTATASAAYRAPAPRDARYACEPKSNNWRWVQTMWGTAGLVRIYRDGNYFCAIHHNQLGSKVFLFVTLQRYGNVATDLGYYASYANVTLYIPRGYCADLTYGHQYNNSTYRHYGSGEVCNS